jgi:C4-type Zn-finger protein
MTINTTCPLCQATIGNKAMKIEPVWEGRVALYDYSCPSCDILLFVDADPALSGEAIMERIDRDRQEIVKSYTGSPAR